MIYCKIVYRKIHPGFTEIKLNTNFPIGTTSQTFDILMNNLPIKETPLQIGNISQSHLVGTKIKKWENIFVTFYAVCTKVFFLVFS